MRTIQGNLNGEGKRVAIAVARFNELVTAKLLDGALNALEQRGVADDDITVVWVPGAFELPQTCRWLAEYADVDAVIALGAVIRGDTTHYDYVCSEAARGILDAAIATSTPIAFGVLTCENLDQALERAGGKVGNKGADAALAVLEMVAVQAAIGAD